MNTTNHSPLPWHACGQDRGGCVCGFIYASDGDGPVAEVTIGKWGDGLGTEHEMIYGEVPEELGKANAALIVHRVNCHDELVEALKAALELPFTEDKSEEVEIYEQIRAALAKAEKLTAEKGA